MVNVSMGVWENFSGKKKKLESCIILQGWVWESCRPLHRGPNFFTAPVHCKTMNGNVLVGGKGC